MLTFFLLATFACTALGETIGFFILGANLERLKHSGAQRVKHALGLAAQHPKDHHVFFLSGANGEAEVMNEQVRRGYKALAKTPDIILETEANFTVKNFILTIPKINAYCQKHNLSMVYLITSGYHMCRSEAILNEFVKARLTLDIRYELSPAKHPRVGHPEHDSWLSSKCGDRIRIAEINDPTRDQSNAHIFATMIAREAEIDSFQNRECNDALTARYLRNNEVASKDEENKTNQLLRLVEGCARKLSE